MSKADQLRKMREERLALPPKAARQTVAVTPFIPVETPKNPEEPALSIEKNKPGRKKVVVTGEAREHFSSSLRPSYKRKIKLAAAVLGINDYEILDQALDEWFAKHKKEIAPDL